MEGFRGIYLFKWGGGSGNKVIKVEVGYGPHSVTVG